MPKFRDFMESTGGKAAAIAVVLLGAVAIFLSVRASFGPSNASSMSRERTFICSQTNKPFDYTLKIGDQIPVKSPHTGQNSGYPAELCYWTRDGRIKPDPTPVLLKSHLGDRSAPTFCPDCNRLVVGHNPRPAQGDKPPPIQSEYKPRRGDRE